MITHQSLHNPSTRQTFQSRLPLEVASSRSPPWTLISTAESSTKSQGPLTPSPWTSLKSTVKLVQKIINLFEIKGFFLGFFVKHLENGSVQCASMYVETEDGVIVFYE